MTFQAFLRVASGSLIKSVEWQSSALKSVNLMGSGLNGSSAQDCVSRASDSGFRCSPRTLEGCSPVWTQFGAERVLIGHPFGARLNFFHKADIAAYTSSAVRSS